MNTQEQFIEAAQNGSLETVKTYLSQPGADIECRGYLNMTALLLSSRNGHLHTVKFLIKKGTDVHNAWYPETKSGSALEMAAENGHTEIVDILLAAGSDANNPITGKSMPLIAAAMGGHLEIINRLIDAEANAKTTTGDKTTSLILISGFGPNHAKNPDPGILMTCMQKIMDAGVDVNAIDNLNQTALSCAVNANNNTIVEFLLSAGADPNRAAAALPLAQLVRSSKCLKLLINSGLKRDFFLKAITTALIEGQMDNALSLAAALPEDQQDLHTNGVRFVNGCQTDNLETFASHVHSYKNTPIISVYGTIALSLAISWSRHRKEKTIILLHAGADPNQNPGYHAPILKAAKAGDVDLLKLLIGHGADPDAGSQNSGTPLMYVVGLDQLYDDRSGPARSFNEMVDKKVKRLIDAGANVNACGPENLTPLMIAIQRFPHNIEPLLQAGADVNAISKYGSCPLMAANPKITRQLIEAGADVHLKNKDGRTALFLSTRPAKADALRKAGADPLQRDGSGMTPLMYHAAQGNMKMVKWFAKYKKYINAVDNKGNNAIMHAYGQNCVEIIIYLKNIEEDLKIINHQGETFLIRSCRVYNPDMIRLALVSEIDINAMNTKGETALMILCQAHDDGKLAKLLIKKGANPFIKNSAGKNALEIARQFKPASALPGLEELIHKTYENF